MTSYRFACVQCKQEIKLDEGLISTGRKIKCPLCKGVMAVPADVLADVENRRADGVAKEERRVARALAKEGRRQERKQLREVKAKEGEEARARKAREVERRWEQPKRVPEREEQVREGGTVGGTDDMERAIARQKSYVGAAVITFLVYWLFYLPGLIVNVLYLADARKTARVAGSAPAGLGCLWIMLILGLLPLIVILLLMSSCGVLALGI